MAFPGSGKSLPHNGPVNPSLVKIAAGATAAVCGIVVAGCSQPGTPDAAGESHMPVAGTATEPRADLSRRVAAAKDRRFAATYVWNGGARQTVTVTKAQDGTWRVDVPGGALGGQVDISLIGGARGVFQCTTAGCVQVAVSADSIPTVNDPGVQHPFTDWLSLLTDQKAPLSVSIAQPITNSTGICFSVEPTTIAVVAPTASGVFCFGDDGLPTAAQSSFGTLVLVGAPMPAPPTVGLPGAVRPGPALDVAAPSASPSARQSGTASAGPTNTSAARRSSPRTGDHRGRPAPRMGLHRYR